MPFEEAYIHDIGAGSNCLYDFSILNFDDSYLDSTTGALRLRQNISQRLHLCSQTPDVVNGGTIARDVVVGCSDVPEQL